jgi:cytochrome d ubiquinol oxidase subunit I
VGRAGHPAHGGRRVPVPAGSIAFSLLLFVVVYGIIFSMGIYYINRLIALGPAGPSILPPEHGTPKRPLSAAEEAGREALGFGRRQTETR